jgi:CDP-diacylglycerol--serine O-phosphatidyltransferase
MTGKTVFLRNIPNSITCLNLFCGCMSVVAAFGGNLSMAAYFIFAAAVFDFLDGFAARWLKAYSGIGKELDSLADMISFGAAPSFIMFAMLQHAASAQGLPTEMYACGWLISVFAFAIAVFSALRLAKFNVDTRQAESFIGLPTPANTLFICSLVFIAQMDGWIASLAGNLYFLLAVIVVFSYLLVAELPLFSLKFKSFGWKGNKIRYIFIALSALMLVLLHWAGLAAVIVWYILLSAFKQLFCKKQPVETDGKHI